MYLAVTTPLHLFFVDLNSLGSSIIRSGDGYYFGVTHKDGVIVLTHSGGYLQFFQKGKTNILSRFVLAQPHQIEFVQDKIVVTNTGYNCLSTFTSEGLWEQNIYLNDIKRDDKNKGILGNHFNTIHKHGDNIYVVAHNYNKFSEVWILSLPEMKVVDLVPSRANWAHNIWIGELGWVICDSKNGSLYDVINNETVWNPDVKGYLSRGLAVGKDYIFVGLSKMKERKHRSWTTGWIFVIDRKTLRTIDKIMLPASGDIHDIRIINGFDECHNDQIIKLDDFLAASQKSFIVNQSYTLRKNFPTLEKYFFPISILVKGRQMFSRWDISINSKKRNQFLLKHLGSSKYKIAE